MRYHSTSKDNIVRHNISYNFAFGSNSLSFIFLKIFAWQKKMILCYDKYITKKKLIIQNNSSGWWASTPLPKTILSAITFPITLSLDRTLYLSYFSRYSRDKKNDIKKRQLHNKKKFIIIPQDDELSLHFQRQYCPP